MACVAWTADLLVDLLSERFSMSSASFERGVCGGVSCDVLRRDVFGRFFGVTFLDGVSTVNVSSSRASTFDGVSSILLNKFEVKSF